MNTVKTEGTVQLSINELDNLRNQISTLTTQNNLLLEKQGQVRINLTVTENYAQFRQEDLGWSRYTGMRIVDTVLENKYRIIEEKEDYIRLEEVEKRLYEKAKQNVQKELGELERKNDELIREKEKLKTANKKDIADISETYNKKIEEKRKEYEKEVENHKEDVEKLTNIIKELKGEQVDYTKDQIIANLQQKIQELETKKGFWGFLHK